MIIATAGHVDHGKTSLLKRLTGVDADRLPEEKRRGLTIDLGFAYSTDLRPGETTGFVDVPGHEKFIHNMLAGVTAIDAALLVVAADDGPMPQTREHLAILDLVGARTGIVALTKTDLVDVGRRHAVAKDIAALLDGTTLAGAPIHPVSSATGEGLTALVDAIRKIDSGISGAEGGFRMAIDRSFVVDGAGLVATGLAQSGSVAVGDRLVVSPSGAEGLDARVRGLRVQNMPTETGQVGDRCAINLVGSGVEKASVGRGQWLVTPAGRSTSRRIDVDFRLLESEERPMRHWRPVHVHVGTADIPGRIALLEAATLAPGETAVAQLVLDRLVCVCRGDAVIVRDQSAWRTVGGGMVLDAAGPRRGRAAPSRLSAVKAHRRDAHHEALAALLDATPGGVDLSAFARNRNLLPTEIGALSLSGTINLGPAEQPVAILDRYLAQTADTIRQELMKHMTGNTSDPGLAIRSLARHLPRQVRPAVIEAAVDELVRSGAIVRAGQKIMIAGQKRRLETQDAELWARVEPALLVDGRPQTVWEVSEKINMLQVDVIRFLKRAQAVGLVKQVSKNRFMTPSALLLLAETAENGLRSAGGDRFTAASFRDWSGLGRNLSIEMLEYFDRAGFTRRAGNERVILRAAIDMFEKSSS